VWNSGLYGKLTSGNPLLNQRSGNLGSTETTFPVTIMPPSDTYARPDSVGCAGLRRHIGGR
jgi:hypothetical protein